jgi:hypothetical protein
MTPTEKGYALEDAGDRSLSNVSFEGSMSSAELRQQALAWFDLRVHLSNANDATSTSDTDTDTDTDTGTCSDGTTSIDTSKFGGGISQQELLRQAKMWEHSSTSSITSTYMQQCQWQEINILTQEITCSRTRTRTRTHSAHTMDYQEFLQGHSVITLPPIISPDECNDIIEAAREISIQHRSMRLANGLADEGLVRIPTIAAAIRAETGNRNTPRANAIDGATDEKLYELLARVCDMLDREHKDMIDALFGTCSININTEQSLSLVQRLNKSDGLSFSSREPAVNVYTKGGEFRPHEDGQKLTVLIPLSPRNDFSGGGTAFWPQDSKGHRVEPPSLTLRPDCGAPILFVGHVVHSGMPVEEGERVVFVASFSPKLDVL